MPQVLAAGAIGALSSVGGALITGTAITASAILTTTLVSGATAALAMVMAPTVKQQELTPSLTIRQATPAAQFVYGRARVAGALVYAGKGEVDPDDVWLVFPIACHEIDAVEAIYDGDTLMWEAGSAVGAYAGKFAAYVRTGTTPQAHLSSLIANTELTSDFTGDGHAYIAVLLNRFAKNWGNRPPDMWARVRGAKVYDPRTDTTAWSANWALCIADYLTHPRGGNREAVDQDALSAAAAICDEIVTDGDPFGALDYWHHDGTGHRRYEINGAFSTDKAPIENIRDMTQYGVGDVYYEAGNYIILAGAYSAPVATIDGAELLDTPVLASQIGLEQRIDSVTARYSNPAASFTADEAPAVDFSGGNPQAALDLALGAEINPERAQRLMSVLGRQALRQQAVNVTLPLTRMDIAIGDRVTFTFGAYGIDKVFEVRRKEVHLTPGAAYVVLTLLEDDASFWDWDPTNAGAEPSTATTSLPSILTANPPQNLAAVEAVDEGASFDRVNYLQVTWDAPADTYVGWYTVYWEVNSVSYTARVTNPAHRIYGIPSGSAVDISVTASNMVSTESAPATLATITYNADPATFIEAVGEDITTTVSSFSASFHKVIWFDVELPRGGLVIGYEYANSAGATHALTPVIYFPDGTGNPNTAEAIFPINSMSREGASGYFTTSPTRYFSRADLVAAAAGVGGVNADIGNTMRVELWAQVVSGGPTTAPIKTATLRVNEVKL